MRLDSAVGLKAGLLRELQSQREVGVRPGIELAAVLARSRLPVNRAVASFGPPPAVVERFSLGIAPRGRDYALAVRVERPELLESLSSP